MTSDDHLSQMSRKLDDDMRELGSVIVRMDHPNHQQYQALTLSFDSAFRTVNQLSEILQPKKTLYASKKLSQQRTASRA